MVFSVIVVNQNMEKSEIMLHGHRQLYSLHNNRRHLCRHCKDVETRFDASNYNLDGPLAKG